MARAMTVHMEITGSSASAVQAARETQTAITQVSTVAQKLIADAQRSASLAGQIDRMLAPTTAVRDRAADIAAYAAEMDALRAKFNPLFAASKQYEAVLEEIARAERLGAITAREATAARDRAAAAMAPMTAANGQLGRSFADLAKGGIQNVSFQIADFATQVGAGGSPAVALAQQLPQLAGGFGVVGAALGALLAIGIPLAAAGWSTMSDKGAQLEDVLDDLKVALDAYEAAQQSAARSNDDLVAAYGRSAGAARELLELQRDMARVDAVSALRATTEALSEAFGALPGSGTNSARAAAQTRSNLLGAIQDQIGATAEEARALVPLLAAVATAPADAGGAAAIRALREEITAAAGGVEGMDAETRTMVQSMADAEIAILAVSSGADSAAAGIAGAAAEADRLADALGRAVGNAVAAASAAGKAASDAQLQLKYYDDPVGLAGAKFDAETAGLGAIDPTVANVLHQTRMQIVEDAQAEAQALDQLTARRKADAEAARAAAGGGGRRGGRGKDPEAEARRGRESVQQMIYGLQAEIDVMRTADPVQQEMIRLRQRMTHATDRQRATVEDLIQTQMAEETSISAQIERMDELRDAGRDALATIRDGMLEGASAGEILGSVLSGIGDRLMDLGTSGLTDILFGQKGTTNPGLIGGVLSSILPFAKGGVVGSPTLFGFGGGQLGLMGEAGPEAIVPLRSGGVGAMIGGRETSLPLTRLSSGDLGVAIKPFARGGVVTAGPLALAGGAAASASAERARADGGRLRLEVSLSSDLQARLLEEASSTAELHVERGLKGYDRSLPAKVGRIRRDPAYMGAR